MKPSRLTHSILAGTAIAVIAAAAPPTMELYPPPGMSVAVNNFDDDLFNVGNELKIGYSIKNSSPPGDQNNMIEFAVPCGVEEGVMPEIMELPGLISGWTVAVENHSTRFSGLLAPGDFGTLELYFDLTLPDLGYRPATALAKGVAGQYLPFNPVPVLVPVTPIWGNADRDVDVDGEDLGAFQACASGPAIAVDPAATTPGGTACRMFDADADADVDQDDFGRLQVCFSGAGNPSACATAGPYPPVPE